jgi:hypothetical protein
MMPWPFRIQIQPKVGIRYVRYSRGCRSVFSLLDICGIFLEIEIFEQTIRRRIL